MRWRAWIEDAAGMVALVWLAWAGLVAAGVMQ